MDVFVIATSITVCTFLGALAGMWLNTRVPELHLQGESKDVVKLVMGLIATVAALVLGLLISSAHRSYEAQVAEVEQIGVQLFQLDRALERFGPEAGDIRRMLRRMVEVEVERASAPGGMAPTVTAPMEAQRAAAVMFDGMSALAPRTDTQRFIQARALQLMTSLGETRLLLNEQARGALSWPFLLVLVFWLTVLFLGFGLLTRRNGTVVVALALGALSVGGATFLILDLNRPYSGVMQISIEPIRNALNQMKQ